MISFRPGGSRERKESKVFTLQTNQVAPGRRRVTVHRDRLQLHTFVVHFRQQLIEVLHGSKEGVDGSEVLHVIAKVFHGGAVEGTDPNRLDVQELKVIQLLLDSCRSRDR